MNQVPNNPTSTPSHTAAHGSASEHCIFCSETKNHPCDDLEEALRNSRGVLMAIYGCFGDDCGLTIGDEYVFDSISAVLNMLEKSQCLVDTWHELGVKERAARKAYTPGENELSVKVTLCCDNECTEDDRVMALEKMLCGIAPTVSTGSAGKQAVYEIRRFEIKKGVCNG